MMKYLLTDSRVKKALSPGKRHRDLVVFSDKFRPMIRNHAQNMNICNVFNFLRTVHLCNLLFVCSGSRKLTCLCSENKFSLLSSLCISVTGHCNKSLPLYCLIHDSVICLLVGSGIQLV